MGVRGRVILITVMAVTSLLLALFVSINRTESSNEATAAASSVQLALVRQELGVMGQVEPGKKGGHGEPANQGDPFSSAARPEMPGMENQVTGISTQLLDAQLMQLAELHDRHYWGLLCELIPVILPV